MTLLLLACLLVSNADAFVPNLSTFSSLSASATRSCTSGTAFWTWRSKSDTFLLACATGSSSLAYNATSIPLARESGTTSNSSISRDTVIANQAAVTGAMLQATGGPLPNQTTFSSLSSTESSSAASSHSILSSLVLAAIPAESSAHNASASLRGRVSDYSQSARSQASGVSLLAQPSTGTLSALSTNSTAVSNSATGNGFAGSIGTQSRVDVATSSTYAQAASGINITAVGSSVLGTLSTHVNSYPSSISAAPTASSKAHPQDVSSLSSTPTIAATPLVIPTTSMSPSGRTAVANGLLLAGLAV